MAASLIIIVRDRMATPRIVTEWDRMATRHSATGWKRMATSRFVMDTYPCRVVALETLALERSVEALREVGVVSSGVFASLRKVERRYMHNVGE